MCKEGGDGKVKTERKEKELAKMSTIYVHSTKMSSLDCSHTCSLYLLSTHKVNKTWHSKLAFMLLRTPSTSVYLS